ncbi:MAG: hypothetical protein QM756_36645 [Polyangiaceae bacterium]
MSIKTLANGSILAAAAAWLVVGCSSSTSETGGNGGTSNGQGGASVANGGNTTANGGSGTANGGASNGGSTSANGGASNGGTSNGGAVSGGASNGGSSNGGSTSGGSASGGSTSGGSTSGGSTSGGSTSGGSTSGGATSGGSTSGGSASGGSTSGGATSGGRANSGGSSSGGATSGGAASGGSASGGAGGASSALAKFSFFVTSYPSMKKLAGKNEGFGGDLRFGKADGLSGADEIRRQIAELGMPGAGQKQWRAFLSVTAGPGGTPVNARDRIGTGPWYDALGRLVSNNLAGLFAAARPAGDAAIVNDLPNEFGQPNHYVGANGLGTSTVDNHDTLTGSDAQGNLRATSAADTCNDWTSTTATGRPYIGHSWPRSATNGTQWLSDHQVPGCAAGVDTTLGGGGSGCVGCSGGFGGFYCFALP